MVHSSSHAQHVRPRLIYPEQRTIEVRDPAQLPKVPIPPSGPPRTVTDTQPDTEVWNLSLDEAIRIALINARVVRVLTGLTATASGQTIYDTAITNTTIDQQQARFDPVFEEEDRWDRMETPQLNFDPNRPGLAEITGTRIDSFQHTSRLNQTNVFGGMFGLRWSENPQTFNGIGPFALNPQNRNALELNYTQPLLQGGGFKANIAPVVIARINTERSYFQYKDSVQEMVRGVIEAYWNLVLARTTEWATRIQVQQSEEAYKLQKARLDAGLGNLSNEAQARVTYLQFRANLVQAQADVLNREAALRNLLFLPPNDCRRIVPTSEPTGDRKTRDWKALVNLAAERRPDIVELKLVLEADQVQLVQTKNQALPRLDAFGLYRWNGLRGELLNGERIASDAGAFTDWTVGINFAVPLGLRQGRAAVRQQELVVVRDRVNLDQGLHAMIHDLALTVRDLDNFYEQYQIFKETRSAARTNLEVQRNVFNAQVGPVTFLNVLQALNDWGNAVNSEARNLLNYNIALAVLERQTGTILETHGLVFYEERCRAAGPLGIFGPEPRYPSALPPAGDPHRYPANEKQEPAENFFDLRNPVPERGKRSTETPDELPPPRPR